jgi:hypothetical protein
MTYSVAVEWKTPEILVINSQDIGRVWQLDNVWWYQIHKTDMTESASKGGYRTMVEAKLAMVDALNKQGIY